MNPTKSDVLSALKELESAMIESIEASKAEENIKLAKMKAHKRLSMARDIVRELTFNN